MDLFGILEYCGPIRWSVARLHLMELRLTSIEYRHGRIPVLHDQSIVSIQISCSQRLADIVQDHCKLSGTMVQTIEPTRALFLELNYPTVGPKSLLHLDIERSSAGVVRTLELELDFRKSVGKENVTKL